LKLKSELSQAGIPVVIKLKCDLKKTKTANVRSKLSEISIVYLENLFPEKY
jgi:hypothetical protein